MKNELNTYFQTVKLPQSAIISSFTVKNVKKFVDSHLRYINASKKDKFIKPYLDRLIELKNIIEQQNK